MTSRGRTPNSTRLPRRVAVAAAVEAQQAEAIAAAVRHPLHQPAPALQRRPARADSRDIRDRVLHYKTRSPFYRWNFKTSFPSMVLKIRTARIVCPLSELGARIPETLR